MEVHPTNPDLQAKLDRWVTETGLGPDELARTREMLNSRYDDLKSGRVKPISREEIVAHFREKSAARQTQPANDHL
ncbi:MAG: hypothetical protein WBY44_32290 [Bryobacteraceae bacterium]